MSGGKMRRSVGVLPSACLQAHSAQPAPDLDRFVGKLEGNRRASTRRRPMR